MTKLTLQKVLNNKNITDPVWVHNALVLELLVQPAQEMAKLYKSWKLRFDQIGEESYDQSYQDYLNAVAPLFYYRVPLVQFCGNEKEDVKQAFDHLEKISYIGYGTHLPVCVGSLYLHRNGRCFCYNPCKK